MLALAFRTDAIKDLDPMVFKACNQQSVKNVIMYRSWRTAYNL